MGHDPRRKGWLLPFASAIVLITAPAAARDLPPAPRESDALAPMVLNLELVINGAATGRIVAITMRDGHYLVAAADLHAAGVTLEPSIIGIVDVSRTPGVEAQYDAGAQRLQLRVPSDWLPRQTFDSARGSNRIVPQSSFGVLVNYDLYLSNSDRGGGYGSFWNEVRVFGAFGVARNTGTYRWDFSGRGGQSRYMRYDTNWAYVDDEHIRTYEVGDLVTSTLSWGNPVRLGGVQLSRNFSVRPDVITYPLPSFSGSAAVPTAVDLFINGFQASSRTIQPGPFTLTDMPYVSGAGEAVVVTTDAQGRRVSTTIPFYVASTLLRPGLSDYAFSAGKLRRDYGVRNFSYGPAVASAAWRYGLTDRLTVEGEMQAAGRLGLLGAGGVFQLGIIGVVNASAAVSRQSGRTGTQMTVGYQYNDRRFTVMASHTRRSRDFGDLSIYDAQGFELARRQTQVNAAMVFGDGLGTFGAGYVESRQSDDRFRLASLSYSRALWGNSSVYLSVNRQFEPGGVTAILQLVVPLGRAGTAVAGLDRSQDGAIRERVDYSRSVPSQGGLGWRLAGADGNRGGSQYQADLTWRTRVAQLQGGVYGTGGNQSAWGDVSGSIVLMDGGVFFADRINDAFVLVTTDGVANVPMRYENQKVGSTDRNGHLLIPWATAYYAAKYEIDPLDLPADMATPVIDQRAAVRRGSGRIVRFPIQRLAAANVSLVDADGQPLASGAPITMTDGSIAYVGFGGVAYLEGLQPNNRITVQRSEHASCSAAFPFDRAVAGIPRIGPVPCR
jgi:outer membrane usher protein